MIFADIISIGDELLIGQTINTNASWMGQLLNSEGIRVQRATSVADQKQEIIDSIKEASARSQIVLITGGLGPTKDDITKKTLCEIFGSNLIEDSASLQRITEFFQRRGLPMLEINRQQALVPDNCVVLHNLKGTANGMWFNHENGVVISMPGVPYEMEYLMIHEVIPRLKEKFQIPSIVHHTILTVGVGESFLAEKIKDWEESLSHEKIHLAYLPSPGMVKLRMSSYGSGTEAEQKERIYKKEQELRSIIGNHIFGMEKDTMSSVVANMLREQKVSLSGAESCTGGMIAHLITSEPGSSEFFKGSMVSYATEAKMKALDIHEDLIKEKSVYSSEVALAMAEGARKFFQTDYAFASTGVAGPTDEGVVKAGTIWVAMVGPHSSKVEQLKLGNNRERNILMASNAALNLIRKDFLLKNH